MGYVPSKLSIRKAYLNGVCMEQIVERNKENETWFHFSGFTNAITSFKLGTFGNCLSLNLVISQTDHIPISVSVQQLGQQLYNLGQSIYSFGQFPNCQNGYNDTYLVRIF